MNLSLSGKQPLSIPKEKPGDNLASPVHLDINSFKFEIGGMAVGSVP